MKKKVSIILVVSLMVNYIMLPIEVIAQENNQEESVIEEQVEQIELKEEIPSNIDKESEIEEKNEEQIKKEEPKDEINEEPKDEINEESKDEINEEIEDKTKEHQKIRTINVSETLQVKYQSHVSKIGWQAFKKNGELSGTTGKSLSVEAIKIYVEGKEKAIKYSTYVQDQGWQKEVSDKQLSGTTGKSKQIEAIKINLSEELLAKYDIYYRVHVSKIGWMDWASNGEVTGTVGYHKAIEGIEIKVVKKGEGAPGKTDKKYIEKDLQAEYQSHVSKIGWQAFKKNGEISGTTGKSRKIEGIKLKLNKLEGNIEYSSYVEGKGWQEIKSNGELSGTTGQSKQIEAIKIKLDEELEKKYDIYYRVHVSYVGWMDWASNGEVTGTVGYQRSIEAIQVKILKKGEGAPGKTDKKYMEKEVEAIYQSHIQNVGWQGVKKNGETSGTTGKSRRMEAIKINLTNFNIEGGIEYQTHVQNIGWQTVKANGQLSGTTGKSRRIEAIRIKLTGELANKYDIYYRAYIQNYGWLGWTSNGSEAGSSNCSLRMEAIQIKIVKKGTSAPGNTNNSYITSYWKTANGNTYFYKEGKMVKGWQVISGTKYFFNSSGVMIGKNVKKIIDVSYAQETIDWDKVKNTDVDGVIVRIGYGSNDSQEDKYLAYNIAALKRLKIPYGIYLYSYAENANEAKLEANFTKRLIKKYTLNPTLGVYLDIEEYPNLLSSTYDSVIKNYINNMKGYTVGIYTYKNLALRFNEISRKYVTWIAQRNSICTYPGSYQMWQYTSSGRVSGITGDVDINIKFN